MVSTNKDYSDYEDATSDVSVDAAVELFVDGTPSLQIAIHDSFPPEQISAKTVVIAPGGTEVIAGIFLKFHRVMIISASDSCTVKAQGATFSGVTYFIQVLSQQVSTAAYEVSNPSGTDPITVDFAFIEEE